MKSQASDLRQQSCISRRQNVHIALYLGLNKGRF